MKFKAKILCVVTYLCLLPPSLYVVSNFWLCLADERIYHCCDSLVDPVGLSDLVNQPRLTLRAILEFLPPFAHPGTCMGNDCDRYIWPEPAVYALWLAALAIVLLLPIIQIKLFLRYYRSTRRANPPTDA